MVLFKASSSGVGRLEFSAGSDSGPLGEYMKLGRQKPAERKVVRLSDCLSVTPAPREACPAGCTAFYLNTKQCNYTFASMSSQDWTSVLCLLAFQRDPGDSDKGELEGGTGFTMEDNDLYSSWKTDRTLPSNQYEVIVQNTEASKCCKLAGKYLVSTNKDDLVLSDISTGAKIYCWPYRLLRRFGQVEGGFSIEAGRRCESSEGIFTFLSPHSPQIFQTITKQCLPKKEDSAPPLSVQQKFSFEVSPVGQPADLLPATPVHTDRKDRDTNDCSECEYYTTSATSVDNTKHLGLIKPYLSHSKEEVGEEGEDEEERCVSLEGMNWGDNAKDSIYYNLRRATLPLIQKNDTDDFYSSASNDYIPSDPQPPKVDQCGAFGFLNPPLADDCIHPEYDTLEVDDTKEAEDTVGSSTLCAACPSEAPGSFKHKLATIISKDLARFQPPLPPGAGCPASFQ